MTPPVPSTLVGFAAPGILAQAGLRRIITEAGLEVVVGADGIPDIVLYDDVQFVTSPRGAPVQVAFQADRIIIAVSAMPTEPLWSDVRKLLLCLDGPAGSLNGADLLLEGNDQLSSGATADISKRAPSS